MPNSFRLPILCLAATCAAAQESAPVTPVQEDDFQVYTEHPRLLLNARRVRLLRRERARTSIRWMQFETLMAGKAQMAEMGFALALYHQASERRDAGRQAIEWALGPNRDLRQVALVFDWCQEVMTPAESKTLAEKLRAGIKQTETRVDIGSIRNRVLAAVAVARHAPDPSKAVLSGVVEKWWRGEIAPALKAGRRPLKREDDYALVELMHAIRDNLNIEMRESAAKYFKELPAYRILTYYPSPFPAAENDYRIPVYDSDGDPDLRAAAMSRAADLALVAYDTNAQETQFVQGWLIHDRYLMRGALGIPYEFLWANPYQPGLSYYHLPLFFHDPAAGRLLLRSSWEDDAQWLSWDNGKAQSFIEGTRSDLRVSKEAELRVGSSTVRVGSPAMRFTISNETPEITYIIALKPNGAYEIEIDDEEMEERRADAGGALALNFPPSINVGVRIRERPPR